MSTARSLFSTASKFVLGAVALLGAASVGHAASESFSISFPGPGNTQYQITNWATTLAVSKFDPSLGVLQSIDYSLTGRVTGTVGFENRDAQAATIKTDLRANVVLTRPDASQLVATLPDASNTTMVSAYDGTNDDGGASGRTFAAGPAADTETFTGDTMPSDFTLFTGTRGAPGTISLPVSASANSSATGAGNISSDFTTMAGADLTVTYNYLPVPEPGTVALTLGGLGALLGVQRLRRRRQ